VVGLLRGKGMPWQVITKTGLLSTPMLLAVFLAPTGAAQALRLQYSAGLDAEYSTNVLRREQREADLGLTAWAGAMVDHDSPRFGLEAAGVAERVEYLDDTLAPENLLALAARADWRIVPNRLVWRLENYLQQVPIDTTQSFGPGNRQESNVLWTGPDLSFRVARLYPVELGVRYGNYRYEETDGDHDRVAGRLRIGRQLSRQRQIFVGGQTMRVWYDHEGRPGEAGTVIGDFDQRDIFVGFEHESAVTAFSVAIGRTYIDRDCFTPTCREDVDGFMGTLSLRRQAAHDTVVRVLLRSRLTDSATDLLTSEGHRLEADRGSDTVVQDIMRDRYAELGYITGRFGVDLGVHLFVRDEDYEVANRDRKGYGVRVDVAQPLAPAWRGLWYADYVHSDYDLLGYKDNDWVLGVSLEYQVTRQVFFSTGIRANFRHSSGPGRDFNEYVGLLALRYGARPDWVER